MRSTILLLLFPILAFSQQHDNTWLFGYNSSGFFDGVEGVIADFNQDSLSFDYIPLPYEISVSSSMISDQEGNLLFYTNGCVVMTRDHEIMENGDGINPGEVSDEECPARYSAGLQSSLILPMPEADSIYILFHKRIRDEYTPIFDIITDKLFYSIINMNLDDGKGAVTEKNVELWSGNQTYGELTAVKHANGVDWWIISMTDQSNEYLFFLLTNAGVEFHHSQVIGAEASFIGSAGAQNVFSPDGKTYARFNPTDGLFIFDFDREEGLLSDFMSIDVDSSAFAGGAIISPNSRVLYVPTDIKLYQFDLYAENIAESKILIDTFDGYASPFLTSFYRGQLAPNCKIYINTFATVDVLHVIHNPNELGSACNFEQHAVQMPFNHIRTIPHFPNYRLGPQIEGEEPLPPCETIVDVEEISPARSLSLEVFPNPAKDNITIRLSDSSVKAKEVNIFNNLGELMGTYHLNGELNLDLSAYTAGLYFCQLRDGGEVIEVKRFAVLR